jgi:uncharacterized membrane protein YfhO
MVAGVNFGAVQDGNHAAYIKYAINGKSNLDMEKLDSKNENNNLYDDNTFYRIDTSESVDNWCMYWGLSSMRTFHSVVPSSIMTFYESIGQTRDVASRMDTKLYALRGLFSVRYYFNRASEDDPPELSIDGLYGFSYTDTQNDFDIYENQHWVPMGFTYDYYSTDTDVQAVQEVSKPQLILNAVVLTSKQQKKYADILTKYEFNAASFTEASYYATCEEKRHNCCYYFSESTDGFKAKINLSKDKLLFFSVPYEDGWTATVNGKAVDIDVVNYGFMAIRCSAGENDIEFSYKTAGLTEGRIISIVGLGAFAAYMTANIVIARKRKTGDETEEETSEPLSEIPSEEAFKAIVQDETDETK